MRQPARRARRGRVLNRLALAGAVLAACGTPPPATPDAGGDAPPGDAAAYAIAITATVDSTRFVVREHMLAGGEMQISGEPLAEAMGRALAGYSRDVLPPDLYSDATLGVSWIDLPGFSTAVESYEYSKQPMNFLAFESGAGTALSHAAHVPDLAGAIYHFAQASGAAGKWVFPAGTYPANNPVGNTNVGGHGDPATNPLGWPGIWPTTHLFASFDPAIAPTSDVAQGCSISSDDSPQGAGTRELCGDYECEATTLHLVDRAAQIDATITPGADGFATWKYGLWTLNYLQVMHDDQEAPVHAVAAADVVKVGTPGFGVELGSSFIEGFQAAMFVLESDARADDWLARLSTGDGVTLSGFASTAAALAYDFPAAPRWFPGRIAVTETPGADGFPVPAYALASADSELLDQLGLAMGYAELFALTDHANADVGGSQPVRAYFDGDPFADDDQLADGEDTVHDRALAMIRVAVIDLARFHAGGDGVLVDHIAFTGTAATRGHTVATTSTAYAVIALRTVLRSLGSQLELYSNNTPDAATTGALDPLPIHDPSDPTATFGALVRRLVRAQAELLYDHLTDPSGRAFTGWDTAAGQPVDQSDTLDAHTAAIRGLFASYLATGDTRYRDRALAVWARLDATFYDVDARVYRTEPITADLVYTVTYTPLRFALVQSMLRDMYELVATRPGGEALVLPLEARIARLNKLVLNGWDDRDRDQRPTVSECVRFDGTHVALGGLQMAERTLTGETGRATDEAGVGPPSVDRDADCVPETDDARLPAALADAVTFTVTRRHAP
ncbi:MAG: hypothetical protein ABI467_05290 [Kofleriaceae bacterium]